MATNEVDVKKKPAPRVGFNDKGKPYPGVDKKTGERMSVSLGALQAEFGAEEGAAKYYAIARLEGEMINKQTGEKFVGRYFFEPTAEPGYRPDLTTATLPDEVCKQVAEILNTKQLEA